MHNIIINIMRMVCITPNIGPVQNTARKLYVMDNIMTRCD